MKATQPAEASERAWLFGKVVKFDGTFSMRCIHALAYATLPDKFHYRGEPTEWVRMTRPGQRLHSFLEGPCISPDGDLWVVDVPYGRIFQISPDGQFSLAAQYSGEPHSIKIGPDNLFYVADHRLGLLAFDPDSGEMRSICSRPKSDNFRGLTDLAIAPNGDVWFSDAGRSSLSDPTGRLFRLRNGQSEPELVLDNIPYPNGIAIAPDGDHIYVASTRANAVLSLSANWNAPGLPMSGVYIQLSGGLGPDGLAMDANGRLAVAQARAGRAYLFDKLGDPLLRIDTPGGNWTTACCFSPDGQFLYITEAQTGAIYRAAL